MAQSGRWESVVDGRECEMVESEIWDRWWMEVSGRWERVMDGRWEMRVSGR